MGGWVAGWLDQMEIRLNSASVEVEVEVEAELGNKRCGGKGAHII